MNKNQFNRTIRELSNSQDIYIGDSYTEIVHPYIGSSNIAERQLCEELKDKYGTVDDFLLEYPFIPKESANNIFLYAVASNCASIHSNRKRIWPFNLDFYDYLFKEMPSNIDKSRIVLTSANHSKLYPLTFQYRTEGGSYLRQPYSNKRIASQYTTEQAQKFIKDEYQKFINDSEIFFRLLSTCENDVNIQYIKSAISDHPTSTLIKKTNTLLKTISSKTIALFNDQLYTAFSSTDLTFNEKGLVNDMIKKCMTFKESPVTYTLNGVQIKIFQTKTKDSIIFSIYFNGTVEFESSNMKHMQRFYRALNTIGVWKLFSDRIESEALIAI